MEKLPNDTGILYLSNIDEANGKFFVDGIEIIRSKTERIFNKEFDSKQKAQEFLAMEKQKLNVRLI